MHVIYLSLSLLCGVYGSGQTGACGTIKFFASFNYAKQQFSDQVPFHRFPCVAVYYKADSVNKVEFWLRKEDTGPSRTIFPIQAGGFRGYVGRSFNGKQFSNDTLLVGDNKTYESSNLRNYVLVIEQVADTILMDIYHAGYFDFNEKVPSDFISRLQSKTGDSIFVQRYKYYQGEYSLTKECYGGLCPEERRSHEGFYKDLNWSYLRSRSFYPEPKLKKRKRRNKE